MGKTFFEIVFWASFLLVFYAYLGYGLLLFFIIKMKRWFFGAPKLPAEIATPEVTFIVCAFNEADWMTAKIENSLAFDYPKDKIRFFFVTDGSDDATPEIVKNYPYPPDVQWKLLHEPARRGKIAAFQRAMKFVETPIVVSTDANTYINKEAIRKIVRHFDDPKTGAVAGEKRISVDSAASADGAGEGIYWKYESLLKKWDAELFSVVGAAGELFAFRTSAYEHVPTDTIIEDFYLTLRIAQKGFRVAYEPDAFAAENSSAGVQEELKRKIRIAAGGLQAIARLAPLLNIFKYGWLSFQYVSHRVLRWTLAPLALPILLIVNVLLAKMGLKFYQIILVLQVIFYLAAALGWVLENRKMKVKAFFVPYYFCMMNYAVFAGFFRIVRGRQSVLWEKSKRTV